MEYTFMEYFPEHITLLRIIKSLIKNKALNTLMSGSGPTIFGLFKSKKKALKAFNKLKQKYKKIYLTQTI